MCRFETSKFYPLKESLLENSDEGTTSDSASDTSVNEGIDEFFLKMMKYSRNYYNLEDLKIKQ